MTAQEYLSQAYHMNQRINSKLAHIAALNDLAVRCTSNLSGMPSQTGNTSVLENTVAKIVDLQAELNSDIDSLIELQKNIITAIKSVDGTDQQIVLERRYLCYESFEKIAAAMGYSTRNVFILHRKALKQIEIS